MHKSVLAGAVALALLGTLSISMNEAQAAGPAVARHGIVVTDVHIAHIKAALRLTPAQEPYWPAVESALRSVVLPPPPARPAGGLLQEIRNNAGLTAQTVAALRRLARIATPLIRTLDATQKRSAVQAARAMGFGHLARAF
jgi:hypothetical protein